MSFNKIRTYHAVIDYVVDGDTCDVLIDLGFHMTTRQRVRLLGIDTPERGQEGYHEAKDFLKKYLGKDILVTTVKTGKFGRWLATLHCDKLDVESINDKLLHNGLAKRYGS